MVSKSKPLSAAAGAAKSKKNLNFQIGLLQAKIGQQPKIQRCALIAKKDKVCLSGLKGINPDPPPPPSAATLNCPICP